METVTRVKSSVRIEDWIMQGSGDASKMPRKSSMIRNIIQGDEALVVVCPKCMVARLAMGTQAKLNNFMNQMAMNGGSTMRGLGLMSYCTMINDQCMDENADPDPDPTMTTSQIMDEPMYTVLESFMGGLTFVPSYTNRDEVMLLTSAEIVDLCRTMHRVPLRITPDNAAWPEIENMWTDMH